MTVRHITASTAAGAIGSVWSLCAAAILLLAYDRLTRAADSGDAAHWLIVGGSVLVMAAIGLAMVLSAFIAGRIARAWNAPSLAPVAVVLVVSLIGYSYVIWIVAVINDCNFGWAFPPFGTGYCR